MPMLRRIWRVSWPSMIEIIGMWSVHAVGIYFIGTMAAGTMGAHAMVVRLESISFMPGFAIGMAASTLTGQYLGARDADMAKKAVRSMKTPARQITRKYITLNGNTLK